MTTVEDGWVVASGWSNLGMPILLCEHSRCKRARDCPGPRPLAPPPPQRDVENDLVAALPLEARGSAPAYARWLAQLRLLVADCGLFGGRADAASPLDLVLADIVCGYFDALAAEAPLVSVVAPQPLFAVAALSPRLTLGEAWAVLVDAFHEYRCGDVSGRPLGLSYPASARADVASLLSDATFETVQGWELTDESDVEVKTDPPTSMGWGSADETPSSQQQLPPLLPKRLPSMASLMQRPLGLFLRQPVRLEFNRDGRWSPNKFMSRDLSMTAACALAGVGVHECPPTLTYNDGEQSQHLIGILPRGAAAPTRLPVLPNAAVGVGIEVESAAAAEELQTVATELQWMSFRDYLERVAEREVARAVSGEPTASLRCPVTDASLSDDVVNALKRSFGAARFLVFDPATGTLRPSYWRSLFPNRSLDLHGNWRVFCDKFLSPATSETLECLSATVAFMPETAHWFPQASHRVFGGWSSGTPSAAAAVASGWGGLGWVGGGLANLPNNAGGGEANHTNNTGGGWGGWGSGSGVAAAAGGANLTNNTGSGWGGWGSRLTNAVGGANLTNNTGGWGSGSNAGAAAATGEATHTDNTDGAFGGWFSGTSNSGGGWGSGGGVVGGGGGGGATTTGSTTDGPTTHPNTGSELAAASVSGGDGSGNSMDTNGDE